MNTLTVFAIAVAGLVLLNLLLAAVLLVIPRISDRRKRRRDRPPAP